MAFVSKVGSLFRTGTSPIAIIRSLVLSGLAEVALRTMPVARAARCFGCELDVRTPPLLVEGLVTPPLSRAEGRMVVAVREVAEVFGPERGNCLRESLMLAHVLRQRQPILRVGFPTGTKGSRPYAHAWLEVSGCRTAGPEYLALLTSGAHRSAS